MGMKRTAAVREKHTFELHGYRCLREISVVDVAEISEQVRILHKYLTGSVYPLSFGEI
jgi:hypothetical protein